MSEDSWMDSTPSTPDTDRTKIDEELPDAQPPASYGERVYGTDEAPMTREEAKAEPKAGPDQNDGEVTEQTLEELLRDAGLSEQVTMTDPETEGQAFADFDQNPAEGDGVTMGAGERDEALSHPEDEARFQGPHRLTDLVALWFAESVERHAQGEQVIWDIAPMSMPDPQQRGMFHPGLSIVFSIKGAVANTIIYNANMEQAFGLNREAVDAWCRRIIEELRQGRSEQLTQMSQQLDQAQQGGAPTPGGGLILPGG